MRWHEQIAWKDQEARLPGLSDGTTVRTFDAPEAFDTRFHEIHAKSVLNRVPGGRKLPFGWTVNTYRGCAHACSYCLSADTKVLLASGRTRRMDHLRPGDEIFGTRVDGRYRRYVKTRVLDHWTTVKPAYRITLADGTEFVASGDHRVLTGRGWKHVTGGTCDAGQRAYLTTNNSLLGTGGFAERPAETAQYRRGYLCGMIRGDGYLAAGHWYRSIRDGRLHAAHQFRLALTDVEGLERTQLYLAELSIPVGERLFSAATPTRQAVRAIYTGRRQHVRWIRDVVRFPIDPDDDWRKGFLAGLFDAEGSAQPGQALRISNTDPTILMYARQSLETFGFDVVVDPPAPNGCRTVRIRGGLRERLRFFHLTDPAIMRKRNVEGLALKSDADLRVVSIERVSDAMRLYDITTGTGDYVAEGVVHHNCFARPTHEYLDFDAGRDFEQEIVVKVNAPEVLRAELRKPSWRGEHIALGTNTDPYQWVEGRYGLTRAVLEVLRDARNPCSVLTKSPLLLRDLELMQELVELVGFSACLSIPTLDERAWRATEPRTPHPRKRLEAVAKLNAAGVPTGVLVAPLMPGINDSPEQVAAVVDACDAAGATRIGGQALFLAGATRDVFMGWLRQQRPDLVPRYEALYRGRSRLAGPEKRAVEGPLSTRVAARRRPDMAARFQRGATAAAADVDGPGLSPLGRAHDGEDAGAPRRGFGGTVRDRPSEAPERPREPVQRTVQEALF